MFVVVTVIIIFTVRSCKQTQHHITSCIVSPVVLSQQLYCLSSCIVSPVVLSLELPKKVFILSAESFPHLIFPVSVLRI